MKCPKLSDLSLSAQDNNGWPWTEESKPVPDRMPNGKPWPRVTVVTPSYNQVEFLEETIRSVLLQGYPDLEYIIMDGGSTDGSLAIIKKYSPWLAYWQSEKDRGQSHAINKGWKRATGDILAWLNSDDVYKENAIQTAVQGFQSHPKAALVYGDMEIIDDHGKYLKKWIAQPFTPTTLLTNVNYIPQQTVFLKRLPLQEDGYLDEGLHMVMDLDLWLRMGIIKKLPLIYLDGVTIAKYRVHPGAKSSLSLDVSTRELIQIFNNVYNTPGLSTEVLSTKSQAFGRIYYENAVENARRLRSKETLRYLLLSLFTYPAYATKRPLDSLYLLKQAALGLFSYE